MKLEKIQIKDIDGKQKFVYNRDIITDVYNKISTKGIALDTIKYGIRFNYKSGTLYASINTKLGKICFSDRASNSNTIIDVFTLDIKSMLDGDKTIEELYHDNFEGFKYDLDIEDSLDRLYSQDYRRCEKCGDIVDNTSVEDYYDEDYHKCHKVYYKCRGCSREYSVIFI